MSLPAGSRLGHYEVIRLLGAGGMGEVYQARDARLGREVALKVLPNAVAADAERIARFDREAKLLAALNHVNIATLYAVEHVDGRHVLAMELAAGEDLSARIDRGPVPLEEALPIAIQIARALEAAHAQGIVHRDLKPANIKLSPDGAVKVLDFGLARAFSGDEASASAMNSPTLTASPTQAGMILGTAAYMSPEQARGRTADKRADIWAFGVVVFEMLSGARLFGGETVSDTLASVLRQEIPWAALPHDTPRGVREVLRRCLERDRTNRLHDIADARIVLDEVARGAAVDGPPAAAAAPRGVRWPMVTALLIAAGATGAAISSVFLKTTPVVSDQQLRRMTIPISGHVSGQPVVAPNGEFVAFVGRNGTSRLYVQRFDEAEPRAIARTDGAAAPIVSPDSRSIAFRRGTRLERISIDGGDPIVITTVNPSAPGCTWTADNDIVCSVSWLGGLAAVPASGGALKTIATPDAAKGEKGFWFPFALPSGRHVLYTVFRAAADINDSDVAVLDLTTGRSQRITQGAAAVFVPPDYLVFYRAGVYSAVRFDPAALTVSGQTARVLEDARGVAPDGDDLQVHAAGDIVAYNPGVVLPESTLYWIAEGGRVEPIPQPARSYANISLARDGRRAAAGILDAGRYSTHLLDLERGTSQALDVPGAAWEPQFHPDGTRVAMRVMHKGDYDIFVKRLDSADPAEVLLDSPADETPRAWTADGRSLIVEMSDADGRYITAIRNMTDRTLRTIWNADPDGAAASPDGRWYAFVSRTSGSPEVYVLPADSAGVADRITTQGGQAVLWSRTKPELLYARGSEIVAVTYRTDENRFRVISERAWAKVATEPGDIFEIAPDGRILVAMPVKPPLPPQLRMIFNWSRQLAERLR